MGRVRRRRWFIGGLAAEAILLAVELSTGGTVVITSGFVVPPLLVALYASPDAKALRGAGRDGDRRRRGDDRQRRRDRLPPVGRPRVGHPVPGRHARSGHRLVH